ncbi:hypothetical protein [Pueribacillus theae]|uniref:hypothetical protein n=1 Tax=Pueribacillus theae TaxID=2171751 RepID=UPI001F0BA2E2|nr:hypothetical protein [Pueribacillus theae]
MIMISGLLKAIIVILMKSGLNMRIQFFILTVGGKTMREHLKVINHRDAITCVEESVQKREPLTEWQIKNIHTIV